jgi:hypothetical protein
VITLARAATTAPATIALALVAGLVGAVAFR